MPLSINKIKAIYGAGSLIAHNWVQAAITDITEAMSKCIWQLFTVTWCVVIPAVHQLISNLDYTKFHLGVCNHFKAKETIYPWTDIGRAQYIVYYCLQRFCEKHAFSKKSTQSTWRQYGRNLGNRRPLLRKEIENVFATRRATVWTKL